MPTVVILTREQRNMRLFICFTSFLHIWENPLIRVIAHPNIPRKASGKATLAKSTFIYMN